ncbi:N-acetylmannosamine-6-phosphate 2-epimerase [Haloimpatiens sp. FM7330]|uniref:N-acetylmannosamine-6-phosphate 2-epimerase n=1 Tax=Haloimpatiens sp. FM7330 TaxID=3298610 RepID=UPI00363C2AC3
MKKGIIVSCQALEDEPLHSSFIMSKMALAAQMAGAVGIRANTVEDIEAIKGEVNLPIIGIIKKDYPNIISYITPTFKEVDALVNADIDVIALDATFNQDEEFLKEVIAKYPKQKFMADISTAQEGIRAEKLGFHFIGTTLVGYTEQSKNLNNFDVLKELIENCKVPILAEGNFDTPEKAKEALKLGAYSVVVGSAITRPQVIAKKFISEIKDV